MWPFRIAPLRVTFNDWKGHFCCLKPLCQSIRQSGSRPRRCAGGVIRYVVHNTGGSRRWLITVTVQLTSTRFVARHARCAIVVPSATMRVQNYAGSGIKRDSS